MSTPVNDKVKQPRLRHTPGGVTLGRDADRATQQVAAAILEVLAGVRTPGQAAEALGVSLPRYYQLETQAMHALVAGCAPKPRGRAASVDRELVQLRRQHERVQRELARQQTLVRLAQRSLGLAPPPAAPAKPTAGKKRRRPVVRALRAAEQLQRQSQEASTELVTTAVTETTV